MALRRSRLFPFVTSTSPPRNTSVILPKRFFHSTPSTRASILFALHALSNSRETQHFNKISRLNRIEHSPPLKLIKTSEVDPFPLPTPPIRPQPTSLPIRKRRDESSLRSPLDEKALRVGRLILSEHARSLTRSQRALDSVKRLHAQNVEITRQERVEWEQEKTRLQRELRTAGGIIISAVGAATALATWRFWPEGKITSAAVHNPAPESVVDVGLRAHSSPIPATAAVVDSPPKILESPSSIVSSPSTSSQRSWRRLLWKQD